MSIAVRGLSLNLINTLQLVPLRHHRDRGRRLYCQTTSRFQWIRNRLWLNSSTSRYTNQVMSENTTSVPTVNIVTLAELSTSNSQILTNGNDSDIPGDDKSQISKISICQLTSTADKVKNLSNITQLIKKAAEFGSKMIFLPEAFDYIATNKNMSATLSERLDGPFMTSLKKLAQENDIWLSLGGFHERLDTDRPDNHPWVANTHVLVNNNGEIVSTYRKIHLFDVSEAVLGPGAGAGLKESDSIKPGLEIVKPEASPIGNIGLGVCYDLRFPEFSGSLRALGADILTFPAAFTVPTGRAHWEPLLRARAIENQCYVIAAAQVGQHNEKRTSYGHSMVIDPWGHVVAEAKDDQNLMVIDVDLNMVKEVRKKMEVFDHRRDDVYISSNKPVSIPKPEEAAETVPFGHIPLQLKFVFMESTLSRAFVNKKCVLPGHVLVISKRPALRMQDLRPAEVADLFQLVQQVQKLVEKAFGATSSTIASQDGPDAGQSVKHFHVHIIPRTPGDFEKNDTVYEKLATHDKGSVQWREDSEMEEEAQMLRNLVRESSKRA